MLRFLIITAGTGLITAATSWWMLRHYRTRTRDMITIQVMTALIIGIALAGITSMIGL